MAQSDANGNMNVFTTDIVNLPDLAKKYLFQVIIEFETDTMQQIVPQDAFMFRAKSVTIPQKEFTDMATEYMGSKLIYPGKANVSGDVTINFDEFQDGWVSSTFHRWQNLIYKQGFRDDQDVDNGLITGGAMSNYASRYCATIRIVLYTSTLKEKLPVEWKLYRCWPKTFSSVDLGMEDDGKIQRSVTLSYSMFEVVPTGSKIQ